MEKFSPHGVQSTSLSFKGNIVTCPLLIFEVWNGQTSVSIYCYGNTGSTCFWNIIDWRTKKLGVASNKNKSKNGRTSDF